MLLTPRIHCRVYKSNDSFAVHHVRDATRDTPLRVVDAVISGGCLHPVGYEREWNSVMGVGPRLMAGNVIDTDSQDLAARGMNPVAYRLKDGQLICSTTGEIARIEPENEFRASQGA